MQLAHDASRQQKLSREEVHLDFATLPAAVPDDPIHTDRRGFRGARGIDLERRLGSWIVPELDVTYLVRDQECLVEGGSDIFVKNESLARNERGARLVEQRGVLGRRFDIQIPASRRRNGKLIRPPGIVSGGDRLCMEFRRTLPSQLDRVHFTRRRRTSTARASPRAHQRRREASRM